ncbi:MAG: YajD family HNH nuclease [Geopsychrobacter sp.]|nr:YajD family HNH nuclease [Geopsychrobacter sp.]
MRQEEQQRQAGYREQALKLFPHVCARCSREHDGKKLRELTVHHKDHNHDNNPPDGSNWVLLCLYCHDQEHSLSLREDQGPDEPGERQSGPSLAHSPFAALAERLKQPK